jgi:hypothetical protein
MNHPIHTSIHSYKQTLPLVIIFLLLLPLSTFAEIRYVSKTGSSTPPYTTWETAADSIQKAINICNDGDTVIVANGVFRETLLLNKEIYLLGSSMDSCVIDMTGLNGILQNNFGIDVRKKSVIENFHIKGKEVGFANYAVIFYDGNDSEIKNCRIEQASFGVGSVDVQMKARNLFIGNTIVGIPLGALDYIKVWEIDNCLIISSRETNISAQGINMVGGNIILTNSIIINNGTPEGVRISDYQKAIIKNNLIGGFFVAELINSRPRDTIIIQNNILINGRSSQFPPDGKGMSTGAGNKLNFKNNIVFDNDIAVAASSPISTDYNVIWNNSRNSLGTVQFGENTVYADPMFVKDTIAYSQQGNFHLQAYSPAIDAGDPDILDVDGSRSDIGLYGGPLGTSYKYLDLPPKMPKGLSAFADTNYIFIKWNKNSEADFSYYNLFRDTTSNFIADSTTLAAQLTDTFYTHLIPPGYTKFYYKLTAVDSQNNESAESDEIVILLTSAGEYGKYSFNYRLHQNYPNPFNPKTIISYTLKEESYVKILIYNITGELILIPVNSLKEPGYHEFEFNGENLASGIYFYRIEAIGKNNIPRFSDIKKMVLIK